MKRHALSDAQWERIHDLFPVNGKRGQQWKDHRLMVDGILWAVKTGAQWRDLPKFQTSGFIRFPDCSGFAPLTEFIYGCITIDSGSDCFDQRKAMVAAQNNRGGCRSGA